jgi:hypothetical protein
MRPGSWLHLLFMTILIAWGPAASAQGLPKDQRPAVEALAAFFQRFGTSTEAQQVRRDFESGRLRIAPVPEDDNADTDTERAIITLNPRLLQEIHRADGQQNFKATADWAATIRHEQVHARQSTRSVIASNAQRVAGLGCPHEVAGWGAGFQAYFDWMERLRRQMGTGSEADREAAASELRELTRSFQEYRQNYPKAQFGDLRINDREGIPISLDQAAGIAANLRKAADTALERIGFVVRLLPRILTPRPGDSFSVTAQPQGGAFDEDGKGDKDRLYTYVWLADKTRLSETGRTLTRKAARTELLTVEASDRHGRKRSASCQVTVQAGPEPTPKPAIPAPVVAAPLRRAGAGAWVLIKRENVDKVLDPARVKSHKYSEGSFQAEVVPRKSTVAVPMEGTWTVPPASLRPGMRLNLACAGAISVQLLGQSGILAFSVPPRIGVWEVSMGLKGSRLSYTAEVASSWFNCGCTYTYEWTEGAQ